MGTIKSGRVLNTRGAAGSASQFSVVHSNEGAYTKPQKNDHIRLKSGGHGQAGMNELDKYGMWKGVRVGVIKIHGQIGTIFPDSKQPIKKGGKK